jgi:hypothetical protein
VHGCRWRCGPWCSGRRESVRARDPRFTAARCPLFLAPAACWCARQTVESTDTVLPMSSSTSAAVRMAARIRSQVPSTAHLISRLCAVWNEPSSSGRSRQGEQVRYFQAMASRVRRWSAHHRPRTGSAGMSGSIRLHIASVITDRTGTSDQLTSPPKRHALAASLSAVPAVTANRPASRSLLSSPPHERGNMARDRRLAKPAIPRTIVSPPPRPARTSRGSSHDHRHDT